MLEVFFGVIFLDFGFEVVCVVICLFYVLVLEYVDFKILGKDVKILLQEFLQGKKILLLQYNVIVIYGVVYSQEFEIECLVFKLDIQVFGIGGSCCVGEQVVVKLVLEVV